MSAKVKNKTNDLSSIYHIALLDYDDYDEQYTGIFVPRTVACTFHDYWFNYHVMS